MTATSKKSTHESLRNSYLQEICKLFTARGEETLATGTNEIAIPCVDANGDDEFVVITVKVPTGSRDGDAYDGYAVAEEYAMKQAEKVRKAQESAKKKAEKIAKDKAEREAKAKAKAEREAEKAKA